MHEAIPQTIPNGVSCLRSRDRDQTIGLPFGFMPQS